MANKGLNVMITIKTNDYIKKLEELNLALKEVKRLQDELNNTDIEIELS